MNRKEHFARILKRFQLVMPVAETELEYRSPYELLVAVILSAQCTDKRVNMITPGLLMQFPTANEMAKATPAQVYETIKSCSYPNNKSKHLVGMAKTLISEFGGVVPSTVENLMKLPGVGRKTANVIAAVVYTKPTMAVDTHVFRVSARLGLTVHAKTPLATEMQLVKYIPKKLIPTAHHWLILHGRYICTSRKPKCSLCRLADLCPFPEKNI